jgi:putative ABC transport system permease protein
MKPSVSSEQLRGALQALTARLAATAPADFPRDLVPVVRSIEDVIVGEVRGTMLLMFAAVGLVLLVSSANAANLLLMRAGERRREVAVRVALGAGPGSIASQLLTESLLLALAAGAAGLALAWASLGALVAALPATLPRTESVLIDARVVLFAMCTAFVTALLTGFPPAASSARADLVSHLRKAGNGSHGARGRRILAAAQVAFGVIVVAWAGLLTRSVFKLQSAPTGMAADRLVFVDLSLPLPIVKERTRHEQFLETLMTRLSGAPFIRAATPVNVAPFSGDGGWDVPRFTAEGQSPERASANPSLNLESVFPTYFDAFGITIVRGRPFTPADRATAPAVAIVSEDVAARTWPGENPLGKRLKMGGADSEDGWRIVVGVAAPTRYREVAHQRATLYLPAAQFLMTARIVVVQSTAPSDLLASTVRAHVTALEPGAQVVKVTPYEDSRRIALAHPRFYALVLGVFGVTALVLATIGLYGVINAHVSGRSREIAIRVAVGASMSNVRRLVLREAFALATVGAAAGLAGAVATTRYARTILFELHPLDPLTLASAALALIGAAAVAAYVPMRRAMRLDPAIMLRSE